MIVLRDFLLFVFAIGGVALPLGQYFKSTRSTETLSLSIAAALLVAYLVLFGLYLLNVPLRWFWILPLLAIGNAFLRRSTSPFSFRDPATVFLLCRWSVLAFWCLGWQGLVVSYSGAAWSGDWFEHYSRAHFFLARWPVDHLFLSYYPLPARPPLVNIVTAGLMAQIGGGFAHYQIITTLISTLVFFPLTLQIQRWTANRRAENLLLLLLMLCPLFVQNATFPWTKLGAAFFVLLAVTQLSPGPEAPLSHARLITGVVLLSAGMLAHYSAGPWIFALCLAGAWTSRQRLRESGFMKSLLFATGAAGLLFATWIGWSLAVYGPATTFTANSTLARSAECGMAEHCFRAIQNLSSTLSPLPANSDVPLLQQTSLIGQWRDYWFMMFQLKLPFAFGSLGAVILVWHLVRLKWSTTATYWLITVTSVILLGTITVAEPDLLGLTHISLQPLVLLGVVWLSIEADRLPRWLAVVWTCSLLLDFLAGIVLHFAIQSFWLDHWLHPGLDLPHVLAQYPITAHVNWQHKVASNLSFVSDLTTSAWHLTFLVVSGLAGILLQGYKLGPSPKPSP